MSYRKLHQICGVDNSPDSVSSGGGKGGVKGFGIPGVFAEA